MPAWLTWMAAVGLIGFESAALGTLGVTTLAVQSGLVATILIGLRREFVAGGVTLAALLPVAEWFAGGPFGYYGLGLVVVFLLCQGVRARLSEVWGVMHFLVAGLAAVVHSLVMAGALGTFHRGEFYGDVILWALPSTVGMLLVVIWPIQWLFARADALYEGSARDTVFH